MMGRGGGARLYTPVDRTMTKEASYIQNYMYTNCQGNA